MNIGISSPEAASVNSAPLESTSPPAAAGAPVNGQPGFGQWMTQALQAQKLSKDQAGQNASADPGAILLDKGTADKPSTDEDSESDASSPAAAWLVPDGLPVWVGMPSIQQVSVGPSMQAITVATTAPDASSLQAFAQQQGLGADAIAWLMNPQPPLTQPQSASPGAGLAAQAASLGLMAGQAATLADAADLGPLSTSALGATGAHALQTPPASALDAAVSAINNAPAVATAGLLAAFGASAAGQAKATPAQTDLAMQGNLAEPENMATAAAVLAGLRWTPNGQAGPKTATPNTPTTVFAQETPAPWSTSELDLGALFGSDASPKPTQADSQEAPAKTDNLLAAPVNSFSRSPLATGQTRPEAAMHPGTMNSNQLQQLSEKMADAIGERMLRELERGQWNMRLMLKPAHLGHIEVEMRLRGGELDATFAAPLAGTRDLLQDGLSRLRDSLAQAGMDVASLHVKTGQNRQNGGDSTHGQRKFASNTNNVNAPETTVAPVESTPRPSRTDGWDVMV